MDVVRRCLAAARQCVSDPSCVAKASYPTRDEFDVAITKLADDVWLRGEPYHHANARALDSEEGRWLYYGRERAPAPEPAHQIETVKLSKAESAIADAVAKYLAKHPKLTYEKALSRALDADPGLYRRYLMERGGV